MKKTTTISTGSSFFLLCLFSMHSTHVSAFQSNGMTSLYGKIPKNMKTEKFSSSSAEAETKAPVTMEQKLPDMEAYASGYSTVFEELPASLCQPTFGKIPADLVGTYYRSGPAMFSAGSLPPPKLSLVKPKILPVPDGKDPNRMVKHPFEGDGAVLAVTFPSPNNNENEDSATTVADPNDGVTARFRYVRTAGFTSERKRGERLYKGMDSTRDSVDVSTVGNDTPLPLFRHHLQPGLNRKRKNTSNTRTIFWAKKLLTLWEGGLPYKLDALALSTEGKSQLGGVLKSDTPFCSKGAYDSGSDRMLFYDNKQDSSSSQLTIYEFNSKFGLVPGGDEGKIECKLPGFAMLSDFGVTENYSVFIQPPIATNGMQYIMSKEPGKTLSIDTSNTALLHLIPRVQSSKADTGIKTFAIPVDSTDSPELEPQFVNAYENDDGDIIIDLIRSFDNSSSKKSKPSAWPWATTLSEYANESSKKSLWRYRIPKNSQSSITKECINDTQAYFGTINPNVSGRKHRFIYATIGTLGSNVGPPQGIAKYDCSGNDNRPCITETWLPEEYEFCGEPLFTQRKPADEEADDNLEEDDGYVLSILYNGKKKESEIIIFSAKSIKDGPITRIPLGMAVPHGYFGCFARSESAGWSFEEIERRAKLGDKMEAKGSMWNEVKSDFSGLGLRLDDFEEYFGDIL